MGYVLACKIHIIIAFQIESSTSGDMGEKDGKLKMKL